MLLLKTMWTIFTVPSLWLMSSITCLFRIYYLFFGGLEGPTFEREFVLVSMRLIFGGGDIFEILWYTSTRTAGIWPVIMCIRRRKIDSEKSVTSEKIECATRVLYLISRIFQMKCATDVD